MWECLRNKPEKANVSRGWSKSLSLLQNTIRYQNTTYNVIFITAIIQSSLSNTTSTFIRSVNTITTLCNFVYLYCNGIVTTATDWFFLSTILRMRFLAQVNGRLISSLSFCFDRWFGGETFEYRVKEGNRGCCWKIGLAVLWWNRQIKGNGQW